MESWEIGLGAYLHNYYIEKLRRENEILKEKLHEKNMQIIKLNELLAEVIDMPNEENSNQPKI